MTHDISDFERQLGQELRAAGYRRLQARSPDLQDRRWRPAALTAAVAAATLVAVLAFAGLRPSAATAHPFRVVYLEDEIRLDVIDVVEDPRSAERELQDELGVEVEFVARPAPPELVDQVVSVSSTGTTDVQPVFGDDGRAERFVLPREIDGQLSIHYGRQAQADEDYGRHDHLPGVPRAVGPDPTAGRSAPRRAVGQHPLQHSGHRLQTRDRRDTR